MTTTYIGKTFEWTGSTNTMVKYYYSGSTRIAMRTGAADPVFLLGDHLGSTMVTADAQGGSQATRLYMPWGELRYTSDPAIDTDYRYTAQQEVAGIGLDFYNARWYDPVLGRFTQPDTMTPESQGVQRGIDMRIQIIIL